jgi:hypothetical protein
MKEGESKFNYLIFGFSAVGIASCVFLSLLFINEESTIMLIVFNLLFASLTFPLNGTLIRKAYLLLMGNIIGLFWNYLFSLFAYTVAHHLGESFNVLYMILSPFVNLVWIVSFWSISLTALASSENRKVRLRLDN